MVCSLVVVMLLSLLINNHALRRQSGSRRRSASPSISSTSSVWAARPSVKTRDTTKSVANNDFATLNDLRNLKGVGPKCKDMLAALGVYSISDLLLHVPRSVIDRSKTLPISDELIGTIATVEVIVNKVKEAGLHSRGGPYIVRCRDPASEQTFGLSYFFGAYAHYQWPTLRNVFSPEARIIVSGKVVKSSFSGQLEMVNPDFALNAADSVAISRQLVVEPTYPLTAGLSGSKLRGFVTSALEFAAENRDVYMRDWMSPEFRALRGWPTLLEALVTAHSPKSEACLSINSAWKERLAFDEFAALQLKQLLTMSAKYARHNQISQDVVDGPTLRQVNGSRSNQFGGAHTFTVQGNEGVLTSKLLASLPFELTQCQKNAMDDIFKDLSARDRMIRCVQGDVGSGKTVVAIMAMLRAVEGGKQAALLVPTDILAKQHFKVVAAALEKIRELQQHPGVDARPNACLITGAVKGKVRENFLSQLCSGAIDIVVGTHALLSENVANSIRSLGIVVIDEEQRFGVEQRDTLGDRSNVLYTTATPIPRSLMKVVEKSYAISTLIEKPPAKRPVQTLLIGISYTSRVLERIAANIPFGSKVFWVTPCLVPSANMPGSSATERFEQLSGMFPGKVALLHGKMTSEEKESVMEAFAKKDGTISILVSTTVVEVGVDVPDASICVIDRAENFGLSSIHQIRGRVGRGEKPEKEILKECFCVLLFQDRATDSEAQENSDPLSPAAKLQILARSNDGFEIAEFDLKLRGPGDIFGMRQHGEAGYKIGCLSAHGHLLSDAMDIALKIHENPAMFRDFKAASIIFTGLPGSAAPSTQRSKSVTATAISPASVASQSEDNLPDTVLSANSDLMGSALVVVFDLETTGLTNENHRIIQLAARVIGSEKTFNAYINPGMAVPKIIVELTGLSGAFLQAEGYPFSEAWKAFQVFLSEIRACDPKKKIVLAAHNGFDFDFPFIMAELKRSGVQLDWKDELHIDGMLDTLALARNPALWKHMPKDGRPSGYSLTKLYKYVTGETLKNGHNAVVDCDALVHVLESDLLRGRWREIANSHLLQM